jgi:hypothetical protein
MPKDDILVIDEGQYLSHLLQTILYWYLCVSRIRVQRINGHDIKGHRCFRCLAECDNATTYSSTHIVALLLSASLTVIVCVLLLLVVNVLT